MPGEDGGTPRPIDEADARGDEAGSSHDVAGEPTPADEPGAPGDRVDVPPGEDARAHGADDGDGPGDGHPQPGGDAPTVPHAELSRLDTLLSRLTGRAEPADPGSADAPPEAGAPAVQPAEPVTLASNDNSNSGLAANEEPAPPGKPPDPGEEPAHGSALPVPGPEPSSEPSPQLPSGPPDTPSGLSVAQPEQAPEHPEPEPELGAAPGFAADDVGGAGDDDGATRESAPEDDDRDGGPQSPWPDKWGAPESTNVLRVLGQLISDLDAPPPAGETRAVDPASDIEFRAAPSEGPAAPPKPAAPPQPDGPPDAPVLGQGPMDGDPPPSPVENVAPGIAPPRPVFVRDPSATPAAPAALAPAGDRTGVGDVEPAARQALAPSGERPADQPTPDAGRPADQPAPARPAASQASAAQSLWILDQPEFRRSFGRVQPPPPDPEPEPEVEEGRPDQAAEPARAPARTGHRAKLRAVAVCGVLAVLGAGGYLVYHERLAANAPAAGSQPASPPAVPSAPSPDTLSESAPAGGSAPAAESLLPRPLRPLQPGEIPISPTTTGVPTLAPAAQGESAGEPTVTIERTAVLPPDESGQPPRDVTRLDAMNLVAANHIANYEVESAARVVDDILARDAAHFGALLSRGRLRLLLDDFASAETDFAAAIEIKPNSLAAVLGLAEALLGQRRGAEALRVVEAAIAVNPEEPAPYDLRARAHAMTGATDQIRVDCAELTWRLGLSYVGEWCEAMAFKDAGRTVEAVTSFQNALGEASEEFIRHRQRYLQFRGHYTGDIDGQTGPATNRALAACATDPNC